MCESQWQVRWQVEAEEGQGVDERTVRVVVVEAMQRCLCVVASVG